MADDSTTAHAKYVPHELKYNADFEDSVMRVVLDDNVKHEGIKVLDEGSEVETNHEAKVMRISDIKTETLPVIHEAELPITLTDARRIFTSAVPGIKLTHPGGYLEGGPGLDPEEDTFARDFLVQHRGISSQEDLSQSIANEVETNLTLLRQRMQDRQRAKEQNEQIEKDIRTLVDQHNMELKIQRRMADEAKARREARDKKRRDREVG